MSRYAAQDGVAINFITAVAHLVRLQVRITHDIQYHGTTYVRTYIMMICEHASEKVP